MRLWLDQKNQGLIKKFKKLITNRLDYIYTIGKIILKTFWTNKIYECLVSYIVNASSLQKKTKNKELDVNSLFKTDFF